MKEDILQDENFKKSIAQRVFLLNLIPGVLGLYYSFMLFLTAFPIHPLFALPIVGYGLLWAYWIEFKTTTKYSQIRWFISMLFNLVGIVLYVFNFAIPEIRWNIETIVFPIPFLLWMGSMFYTSCLAFRLSQKINRIRIQQQKIVQNF